MPYNFTFIVRIVVDIRHLLHCTLHGDTCILFAFFLFVFFFFCFAHSFVSHNFHHIYNLHFICQRDMSLYNLVRSECVLSFDRIFAYFFIHSLVACSAREHTKKKHIFRVVACRIGNAWCLFFIVVVYFVYNMSPIGWCVPVCGPRGRYRSVFIPHCFLLPLLLRHSGYASPLFLHWRLRGFACLHQPFRCQPLIFLFFFYSRSCYLFFLLCLRFSLGGRLFFHCSLVHCCHFTRYLQFVVLLRTICVWMRIASQFTENHEWKLPVLWWSSVPRALMSHLSSPCNEKWGKKMKLIRNCFWMKNMRRLRAQDTVKDAL